MMNKAARQVLESFEALPETERESVVVEILRRARAESYPAVEDEDLILAADEIFLELDRREDSD
jgi:hypothetical protein